MKNILITGVTGIVGSHVFYEIISDLSRRDDYSSIYLLVRPKNGRTGDERIEQEVLHQEVIPDEIKDIDLNGVLSRTHVIEGTLDNCEFPKCMGREIDVFHIAASVNLGTSEKSFIDIYQNNYQATHTLLYKLKGRISKFNFVSTAFSSGDRMNEIEDDFHTEASYTFRNHYEKYKFKLETELLQMAKDGEFKCTIMRPSVVCGRLIREPHFVMNRYIVFYMIGAFLKRMTKKYGPIQSFRLVADPESSLNIVPVDYVAKGIWHASKEDLEQVNITLSESVPNKFWLDYIFNKEGVVKLEYVDEVPQDANDIERLYYQTVGSQITKYVTSAKHTFPSSVIRKVVPSVDEPAIVNMFPQLYDYAHDRDFKISA